MPPIISQFPRVLAELILPNWRNFLNSREPQLWLLSLFIGIGVGIAAILFRQLILLTHFFWLGVMTETMVSAAIDTHWAIILFTPALGGLLVGWLLNTFLPSKRTNGVADVIEAKALGGDNITLKTGLGSAFVSALSLGFGASAGREGPMVHLGSTVATSLTSMFNLPVWARRTLLGCGVASAVSASFNAPIAGVLFAHEVILGHYSKRSFIPIVISSVMGTILTRLWFGGGVAFAIPNHQITSYLEFPAFALLGVVCALIAISFQFSIIATDYIARSITLPLWLRPAVGGLIVGAIGIFFPQVLGVGYEATSMALKNHYSIAFLIALIVAKTAATSITLASRFGGGVFSPSLYIGAMAGGAFGLIASRIFPELSSSEGLYAILGMGAVAAAVIGAPISTTVIVFELTGGYTLSIALLLTVSIAVGVNQALHGRSFFQWQLELRGLLIQDGPHRLMARNTLVADFMTLNDADDEQRLDGEEQTPVLKPHTNLESALRTFDEGGYASLPVVHANDETLIIGTATQVAALNYYNKALVDMSIEEHK